MFDCNDYLVRVLIYSNNLKPQIMRVLLLAPMLYAFFSCEQNDVSITIPEKTAEYKDIFTFNWNKNDFPTDYPSGPHFFPLVGWVHQKEKNFF